jgi:hypothetical protein
LIKAETFGLAPLTAPLYSGGLPKAEGFFPLKFHTRLMKDQQKTVDEKKCLLEFFAQGLIFREPDGSRKQVAWPQRFVEFGLKGRSTGSLDDCVKNEPG